MFCQGKEGWIRGEGVGSWGLMLEIPQLPCDFTNLLCFQLASSATLYSPMCLRLWALEIPTEFEFPDWRKTNPCAQTGGHALFCLHWVELCAKVPAL